MAFKLLNPFGRNKKTKQPLKQKNFNADFNPAIFPSLFLNDVSADFISFDAPIKLLNSYKSNPIVNAVINIKANAFSNLRFKIEDLRTNEVFELKDAPDSNIKKLLTKPNAWQTSTEWKKMCKIHEGVFGNMYLYGSIPTGFRFSGDNISVLNFLPPYLTKPIITGDWLDATDLSEIVREYQFKDVLRSNNLRKIPTEQVLHMNEPNITYDPQFVKGVSKLVALNKPISNIDKAFESRNVLIKKRGALGYLTSDRKSGDLGTMPLQPDDIEQIQDAYSKYGLLDNQYGLMILNQPVKYQEMGKSVKDLMLFEEVESSAIQVSNTFGVPELLTKAYVSGGTFENLQASERRLYDSTIIPETKIFIDGLNDFLKTEELGLKIHASFEHVKVLQNSKKEESETRQVDEQTALSSFKIGAFTYNQYLQAIGQPNDTQIGDLRIWDLQPNQIAAIVSDNNVLTETPPANE